MLSKDLHLGSTAGALAAALLLAGVLALCGCAALYRGPVSDHFDGSRFHNQLPDNTFLDHLKWWWQMDTVVWPKRIDDPPQSKPPASVLGAGVRVTYINHATVLLQTDGLNILTDPIWSKRAGPYSWAGSIRIRVPGVAMKDLPKIDVVLISHDHYDHLDLPTLKTLIARDHPIIMAGLGLKALLDSEDIGDVEEMDWWQEARQHPAGVRFTFVPALHSSGRGLFQNNRTLWGGFVIEGSGGRVYFAGDTGYGPFLQAVHDRFPSFRLTILPIGNYEKRWFMKNQHMNPSDAVQAHLLLDSRQSVGFHYATFNEHPEQTINAHEKDLATALQESHVLASQFWVLGFGEGRDVSK